ncbi:MAG: hypothetical protein EOP45_16190 [Sphingobacteriaceae bacterium]|nr:MAG: hypothetical protein EOP45_16190 [Sphingobacteriaceae bacterium]
MEFTYKDNNTLSSPIIRQVYSSSENLNTAIFQIDQSNQKHYSKINNFNGSVTLFNLLDKNRTSSFYFTSGRLSKVSITKSSITKSDSNIKALSCTAWYLETITYYSDGTNSATYEYLFTTCDGGCQSQSISIGKKTLEANVHISDCGSGGGSTNAEIIAAQDAPKACLTSFQFSQQGLGPGVNSAYVWGIFGAIKDRDSDATIRQVTFGLNIQANN